MDPKFSMRRSSAPKSLKNKAAGPYESKSRRPTSEAIRFGAFPVPGIEAMTASTARSYPRHTHDQYGIGVLDKGGHASWSGRGQVEAEPGNLICVNPGEVHDGRPIGQQPRSWRLLYIDPSVMEELCADIRDGARTSFRFDLPVFGDEVARRLFDEAFTLSADRAKHSCRMACETALVKLGARLLARSRLQPWTDQGPAARIRRARDRIDADPAAPITLAQLAADLGLSRFQLIRGFASELGLTPHAYLLQRRVALARRLIRSGCALAQVAALAGFCDQSHMTRCFVRQFGISPSRYAASR